MPSTERVRRGPEPPVSQRFLWVYRTNNDRKVKTPEKSFSPLGPEIALLPEDRKSPS